MIHHKLINDISTPSTWQGIMAYGAVYFAIYLVFTLENIAHLSSHPILATLAMVFIAGRQHSLYILNHDASHGSLFLSRHTNRLAATLLSVAPMLHHPEAWSFVDWRRTHMKHHGYLFTERDSNYQTRLTNGDTNEQITSSKLAIKMLMSIPMSIYSFFKINHLKSLLLPTKNDREMRREWFIQRALMLTIIALVYYFHAWKSFLLFWMIPMYTFYPMILTYFDLTEHYWEVDSLAITDNTRSVRHGFWISIVLTQLPRGFHREHHLFPRVPSFHLHTLNKVLNAR